MSDIVVDSSVVAKWILPESDSAEARRLMAQVPVQDARLFVLDLALIEVDLPQHRLVAGFWR